MPSIKLMQSDECSPIHRRFDVLSKRLELLDRIVFCNENVNIIIKHDSMMVKYVKIIIILVDFEELHRKWSNIYDTTLMQ